MDMEQYQTNKEDDQATFLEYREVVEQAYDIKDNCELGRESVRQISSVLEHAERLTSKVRSIDNALLDAKVVCISSQVLKQNAEYLSTNLRSYDEKIFADNILGFLKDEPSADDSVSSDNDLKWEKLTAFTRKCFKYRTPPYVFMLGTFQVGELALPLKKARKQREKEEEGNKKKPENVERVEKVSDGIEETVNYIMKTLVIAYKRNNEKPIPYFDLVLNPVSFGSTVENIFHVAFLVKDGHADFSFGADDMPLIEPVTKEKNEKRKDSTHDRRQMILSISMLEWRELVDALGIKTPMLKPRIT